jgi:hypothetical protein
MVVDCVLCCWSSTGWWDINQPPRTHPYPDLTPHPHPPQFWPWEDPSLDPMQRAFRAMHANFEFMDKLGVELWCFHDRWGRVCVWEAGRCLCMDLLSTVSVFENLRPPTTEQSPPHPRDIAPEADTLEETNRNLDQVRARGCVAWVRGVGVWRAQIPPVVFKSNHRSFPFRSSRWHSSCKRARPSARCGAPRSSSSTRGTCTARPPVSRLGRTDGRSGGWSGGCLLCTRKAPPSVTQSPTRPAPHSIHYSTQFSSKSPCVSTRFPPGPNATVFAYAAAQVKKAMDVTQLLGGTNYVFWWVWGRGGVGLARWVDGWFRYACSRTSFLY